MIISLIGFMAAGKTTMARELSAKVGAPMIDTDAYIEEREGKTISEIFAAVGEPGFRKIEEECLEDILEEHISEHPETLEDMHRCTLVLSLGGGIVTTPGCRDLISRFTYCVYVKTDIDTIFNRLSKDTGGRTLLENRGDTPLRDVIDRLYREREPLYEALARTTVRPFSRIKSLPRMSRRKSGSRLFRRSVNAVVIRREDYASGMPDTLS